jgi:flagellar basal-body rod modification protein FlgD
MTTPVTAVNTVGTTSTAATTTSTDNSQLSSQAFLQLLVAQLRYQDPTKPVDTATLMSQTATLNQIQTMQQLTTASAAQTTAQQQQTATSMVGHTVTYTDSSGATITGHVDAATVAGTTPTLQIGGQTVALGKVQQVLATT